MSLIYITGPSGAGKTIVPQMLKEEGFEAHMMQM